MRGTIQGFQDGATVLFERTKPGIGTFDLWITDLARNVETRLTIGHGLARIAVAIPTEKFEDFVSSRIPGLNDRSVPCAI